MVLPKNYASILVELAPIDFIIPQSVQEQLRSLRLVCHVGLPLLKVHLEPISKHELGVICDRIEQGGQSLNEFDEWKPDLSVILLWFHSSNLVAQGVTSKTQTEGTDLNDRKNVQAVLAKT